MPESKKVVIKVDIHDNNDKRKVLKAVSSLLGIDSLAIDKDKKLRSLETLIQGTSSENLKNGTPVYSQSDLQKNQVPRSQKMVVYGSWAFEQGSWAADF
ncbi:hypothetical protein HanRHA438_Chr02g0084491 [Helianthus annuus]|nr:hypothetical protein HanRHA438_Chr02g0084491 [Helianthus annuus]